jgi:hypothetical protein
MGIRNLEAAAGAAMLGAGLGKIHLLFILPPMNPCIDEAFLEKRFSKMTKITFFFYVTRTISREKWRCQPENFTLPCDGHIPG